MCKCEFPTGWGYKCDGDWCADYCKGWHDADNQHGVARDLTTAEEPVDLVHE